MRSRADRSTTSLIAVSLCLILFCLGILAGCGKDKTPTNPPPPAVGIAVAPLTASVARGSTQTFTATVTNTTNTAVTWSIDEGTTGGSITTAGVYTPPTTLGTYHVTATSAADTSKKATAAITVTDAAVVAVTPTTVTVAINAQHTFTATVTDVVEIDQSVTWSVQETTGGTIDAATGVYTAPNKAGTYHVVATSVAFPARTATAAVTITAPAPTFDTTAPTAAAEAEVYTYTPALTDPAGGTVELSLVNAPDGAKLEEGVLTWTPAKEQSRVENTFEIAALTSEGGTAVQTWKVTPTGIIRGVMVTKHLHAAGVTDIPVDLSNAEIYAYVPAEDKTLTELAGTGDSEGAFEIPGVAAGKYWLAVYPGMTAEATADVSCFGGQVLTDRSDIDLSCFVQGRADVEYASEGTQRHFNLQGLSPWQQSDLLRLSIPNARELSGWSGLQPDSISYDGLQPAWHLAAGDAAILGQWTRDFSNGGRPYQLMTKVLNIADLTDTDGETSTITGTLQDVVGTHAFDATIAGSEFKNLNAAINPNTTTYASELYIEPHPFGLSHGYVHYGAELFLFNAMGGSNPPVETDVYLGQFTYGNPFPSTWPLMAEYWHNTLTSFTLTGGTTQMGTNYFQMTDALPTLAQPVKPILGPATNASVDEIAFFDGGQISTTPTISWEAPETGTAQGYDLWLLLVTPEGIFIDFTFRTTETSVVVPAGLLQPGNDYVFAIRALNETGQDLAATPFMMGFPRAAAWTVSGVFNVGTPTQPAARAAMAKKLSGFKPLHKLTKSLGDSQRQLDKPVR